jgi:hypothetical protein
MRTMWAIGLFLSAVVGAGEIKDASLIGDRAGWHIDFDCNEEPLSRIWQPQSGVVRLELQNFRVAAGTRSFSENPWFSSMSAVAGSNAVYDFKLRPGVTLPDNWVRAWDGRHFRIVLSRLPVSKPYLETMKMFGGASSETAPAAALDAGGELQKISMSSSADQEVIDLQFSKAPLKSSLRMTPNGLRLDLELAGARLVSSKLGSPRGDGWNVRGLAIAKEGKVEVLRIELADPIRSAVLNRMGDRLTVRMRREGVVAGVRTWESGKAESFGTNSIPADEMQTLGKAKVDVVRKIFTPASSVSSPPAVTNAASGQEKGVRDAELLEVERRKSQEFALKQKLDDDAKQTQIDEKNRIVYHTFGVRDPFVPLDPGDAENGLNIDQMKVVGIIFSKSKRMVVLEHVSQSGLSVALKEGDPIQNGRVLRIEKERVIFLLEEFGQTREFALRLQAPKGDRT